jgi:hypothetical protein
MRIISGLQIVCYTIMDHTYKLHVIVSLANSFGSRIDPTLGQKTRTERKVETLYIVGMETSHFTLKYTF